MWPTPMASVTNDAEEPAQWLTRRERHARKVEGASRASLPLTIAVKLWPTPTCTDARSSARHGYMKQGHPGTTLLDATREWAFRLAPTTCPDGRSGSRAVFLNPDFVDALLGFPIAWTASGRGETQSLPW